MNTRSVLWLGAVVCLAVGWTDPPQAEASDFLVRLQHVSPDESEPEIPNRTIRDPQGSVIDIAAPGRTIERTPMLRPENWLWRVIRSLLRLNLGGMVR